jgi:GrpB-like predicted nucleotidyltransferase (UPF0157 family)
MLIEKYNENWENQFITIKNILEKNLTNIISIEHVGSTSIKGMYAKPIIDIDIIIHDDSNFEITKTELSLIGYHHNGNQGIAGREAFKRNKANRDEILDEINHHLYVCAKDNDELKRHMLFRDYFRQHKEKIIAYNNIKIEILKKYGENNREKYVEVKENDYKWFFEEAIKEAEIEMKQLA